LDCKNPKFFDFKIKDENNEEKVFHPNISKVKSIESTITYILKDIEDINTDSILISENLRGAVDENCEALNYKENTLLLAETNELDKAV